MKLIDKDALVAEIERRKSQFMSQADDFHSLGMKEKRDHFAVLASNMHSILSFIDTLEVKDVELMIHTIIAECCDWLATHTFLSYDEIEGCRNLMLTVKEEQFKAQKGEQV